MSPYLDWKGKKHIEITCNPWFFFFFCLYFLLKSPKSWNWSSPIHYTLTLLHLQKNPNRNRCYFVSITSHVLLLFNFKPCLPFLYRDLSKSWRCHFVLLHTQQCDVNIKRATTLISKNSKRNYFYFLKLIACRFCINNIKIRNDLTKCGQWRLFCRMLILTERKQGKTNDNVLIYEFKMLSLYAISFYSISG